MFLDVATTFSAARGPGRFILVYFGGQEPTVLTPREANELRKLLLEELIEAGFDTDV